MYFRQRYGRMPKMHYLFLLLAIAGGVALNLFSTLLAPPAAAQNTAPADRIAFTRDDQIFVANPDGTGAMSLGRGSDPSWSKQGRIAFTSGTSEVSYIAVRNEDGTTVRLTPVSLLTSSYQPEFSPDETRVAFVNEVVETLPGQSTGSHKRIYIIKADGTNLQRFTNVSGVNQEMAPAWSPDGQKIAFIGETIKDLGRGPGSVYGVYVADANGEHPPIKVAEDFYTDDVRDPRRFSIDSRSQIAWSPDGQKLAIAANQDIYLFNADGSDGRVSLTNSVDRLELDPAWSPDGRQVAYAVEHVDNSLSGIYVIDIDSREKTFLNTGGYQPTWRQREVTPAPVADLAVALTAAPDPATVGQNLTYTMSVSNNGPATAEDVQGRFALPANTQFVSVSAGQGSCGTNLNTVNCQLGQLAANAQTSVQVTVSPTAAGQLVADSAVSSQTSDNDPNNNEQQLVIQANDPPAADVAVQLTAAPNPVTVGQNLIYTMVVSNSGPAAAENLNAKFTRAASLQFVSTTTPQGTCTTNANATLCQLGQLSAGAQTSIQIVVRPTAAGQVEALAEAGAQTPDSNQNNNAQQLAVTVDQNCATEVTGQVQQSVISLGIDRRPRVLHTIFVRNNSGRTLNGPVHLVFDGLASSVENADQRNPFARTQCAPPLGRKYMSLNPGVMGWRRGQTLTLLVEFANPERVRISYRLRIYTGPGNP